MSPPKYAVELNDAGSINDAPRVGRPLGLRQGTREYKLFKSSTVFGRGQGADYVLNSALVSRRHAVLTLGLDCVVVEDLGSRNGVFVNSRRIEGSQTLLIGDTLTLGDESFMLVELDVTDIRLSGTLAGEVPRESGRVPAGTYTEEDASLATRRADAFQLLGSVVDKALAFGRGAEAEHLIGTHLVAAMSDAKSSRGVPPELARSCAIYALKLAVATGKPTWLEFPIRLYHALRSVAPLPIVDEMYVVLRRVHGVDRSVLRRYIDFIQQRIDGLSATERFILQRLEGLDRLASWQAGA